MKNSKKILSLSMAATMLAGSTTAFAMPADVIVLGDKAFEILALSETDNTELQAEINAALDATDAEGMFYRLGSTGDFKKLAEDDVVMTAAQQTALKNVVLTKADGTKETYANFEDETGTVVEQADLTAYNAALNAVTEADYTAESWVIYQAVVTANVVTVSNTQAEVDAAKDKIVEAQKALVSVNGLAVESVSAVNVNKLKVTFNTPADDTKATFAVKRGTVTENVSVTWNETKTEATLTKTAGNFAAAEYTVTVGGVEIADSVNSGTATIEAEKVETVVINTASLQKSATAPVSIDFVNQYGEKAAILATDSKLTLTAYNVTKGVAIAQVTGEFQLNAAAAAADDVVNVNVLYDGISATKQISVVNAATVGSVTLGEVVLPEGKTMFTPAGTKNVEVKYTATNTVSEEYKLLTADVGTDSAKAVKVISSDDTILDPADVTVDANNKMHIAKFKKAGDVNLTVMTTATGQTSTVAITVNEDAGSVYTIALADTTKDFAAGSADKVYSAITVTDKYGAEIVAKDLTLADFTFTSDNGSVVNSTNITIVKDTTNDNYGKLQITPETTTVKGNSAVITVTVNATGQKTTLTVSANDAAVPTSVDTEKDTTVATNMLNGATQTINFDVKDQYEGIYSATAATYTVEYTTSDVAVLAITSNETTKDGINAPAVSVEAKKAGSATLKAQLKKDGVAIAEKAYAFTIGENTSTGVTYSIPDIDVLYKNMQVGIASGITAGEMDVVVNDGYAKEFKVIATDASGNTYQVPSSAIVSITTDSSAVGIGTATDGKMYVSTETVPVNTGAAGADEDQKVTISVVINADDTVKTITKEVTVSKDDLKAQSLAFKNKNFTTVANRKDAINVDELTLSKGSAYPTGATADIASAGAYLWIADQFGGYDLSKGSAGNNANAITISLVDVDGFNVTADTVALAATQNGTINVTEVGSDTTFTKDSAKFRVIAVDSGLSDFIDVTMTDGILPTLSTSVFTDVDSNGVVSANDKLVLTFNEAMNKTTADALVADFTNNEGLEDALFGTGNGDDFLGATAGTDAGLAWNTAGTELTITVGATPSATGLVGASVDFTNATEFKDAAGNAVKAADSTVDVTATTQAIVSVVPAGDDASIVITLNKAMSAAEATAAAVNTNYTFVDGGTTVTDDTLAGATFTAVEGQKTITVAVTGVGTAANTIKLNKAILGTTADSTVFTLN